MSVLPSTPEALATKGERKQVTVLFADVVGSMELAERSDPEEWRRVMDGAFAILSAGVQRYEGTVDRFTGDGIMALFGAPIAHEDHARRACYAALDLQRELTDYGARLCRAHGLDFSVRIGLDSGEVVVGTIGDDLAMEYTALGHTVGVAQRIEQLAAPGSIYVSARTAWLAEGHLALTDLGEFRVRGASRPLRVCELTGIGAARGGLDVARSRGFSRFVGRDAELHALDEALEEAMTGQGGVVGIVGEAGVGKSRLCHEFTERHRAQGVPVYHVAGQAHATSVPLLPVLQFLRSYFDIGAGDTDSASRDRIVARLGLLDERFGDDLPLLFDFLAVPDPERPAPRMDPEARQRRLLGLTQRLGQAQSAREPGIIVFEDVHWLDPASEVFLAGRVQASRRTRSLTIVTSRPEYRAAWMSSPSYRRIALPRLRPEAVEELLGERLGSDPSLGELAGLIGERTQGNPFFIEELVQALVEAGTLEGERGSRRLVGTVDEATVPASVQAVLAARIDRLGPEQKAVLQAAAVIGKELALGVLQRVVALEPEELADALRALVASELLVEQEEHSPHSRYAFKHPLTREVAYGSQLSERRAALHAAAARAMEDGDPGRLEERAALVADHWEHAGEALEAARWHARAGAWAGYNDPRQALWHASRVRALADGLEETDETAALGLASRIASLQFGWRLGISREEAEATFAEAEPLAARAGDVRARVLLLLAHGGVRGLGQGEVHAWAGLVRQALDLAEESGRPELYVLASPGAVALSRAGAYREGVAICDRAIELAAGDPTMGAGIVVGCPYAFAHGIKGFILAETGELEQARHALEKALSAARAQHDDETIAFSHLWSTWLAYFRGEPIAAVVHALQAIEITERIGGSFARSWAWLCLGLAECMSGAWSRAIDALQRSTTIAREGRTAVDANAWRLSLLGEAHLGAGDLQQARACIEESLEIALAQRHEVNEKYARLAVARLLLATDGAVARGPIEAALDRALQLARDTGAKAVEPMVHVERAELARLTGDDDARERELRRAHTLFEAIGATGHAERLSAQLTPSACSG